MDRARIISYLQAAEDHIANGEHEIAQQRDLISSLERAGNDPTGAAALLREMEQAQIRHIADRDRLRAELALSNAAEAAKADASILTGPREPRLRLKRRIRRTPYSADPRRR